MTSGKITPMSMNTGAVSSYSTGIKFGPYDPEREMTKNVV
jgi:hypothetical protein